MRVFRGWMLFIGLGLLSACATDQGTLDPRQPVSRDRQAAEVNVQLGAGYLRKGNYERALDKLKRALSYDESLVTAHSVIAVLYGEMGEDALAQKHFARALQLAPDDAELHNNHGTYLCNRHQLEQALLEFQAAWSNPRYRSPEVAYGNAGNCALRIPDTNRAEQYFRRALQYQPKYAPALMNMAALMYEAGEYLRARGYLQRYETFAQHTPGTLWLGIRNEHKLNNPAQAEQYREQLLRHFPDSDEAHLAAKWGRDGQ